MGSGGPGPGGKSARAPEGRIATCRFAAPHGDRVAPAIVDVRLADLDVALPALRALGHDDAAYSASVRAWRDAAALPEGSEATFAGDAAADAFAELGVRMPVAAHAVLNPDGTAVTTVCWSSSGVALPDSMVVEAPTPRALLALVNRSLGEGP